MENPNVQNQWIPISRLEILSSSFGTRGLNKKLAGLMEKRRFSLPEWDVIFPQKDIEDGNSNNTVGWL
jgi:hypothetical protein